MAQPILRNRAAMTKYGEGIRLNVEFQNALQFGADHIPNAGVGPVEGFRLQRSPDKRCEKLAAVWRAIQKKRRAEHGAENVQTFGARHKKTEATNGNLHGVVADGRR